MTASTTLSLVYAEMGEDQLAPGLPEAPISSLADGRSSRLAQGGCQSVFFMKCLITTIGRYVK